MSMMHHIPGMCEVCLVEPATVQTQDSEGEGVEVCAKCHAAYYADVATPTVHIVDATQYCASCQVIECATQLCDACLDDLLEHMAVELDGETYKEQYRVEGGLY